MKHYLPAVLIALVPLFTAPGVALAQPPVKPEPPQPMAVPQPKEDLTSPEGAVRSFLAALTLHDVDRALACVYKANTRNRGVIEKQMQWGRETKATYSVVDIDVVKIADRPYLATVRLKYHWELVDKGKLIKVEDQELLPVHEEGPGAPWQLLALDPAYQWTGAQGSGLQMFATDIAHPEVEEPECKCLSRIDSLCESVLYVVKNRCAGVLAIARQATAAKSPDFDISKWSSLKRALLAPGFAARDLDRWLHCPGDGDDLTKESYAFNDKLDGLTLATIGDPQNTILVYEGRDGRFDFRHDGRAAVGFVDGDTEMLDMEQVKTLAWVPKLK